MWEVFTPHTGAWVYRTRFKFIAMLIARLLHNRFQSGLDYARAGEGWAPDHYTTEES